MSRLEISRIEDALSACRSDRGADTCGPLSERGADTPGFSLRGFEDIPRESDEEETADKSPKLPLEPPLSSPVESVGEGVAVELEREGVLAMQVRVMEIEGV